MFAETCAAFWQKDSAKVLARSASSLCILIVTDEGPMLVVDQESRISRSHSAVVSLIEFARRVAGAPG